MTTKHLVIPDTQVKPGVPLDHLSRVGQYIVDKRPDVVVMIGDFADMESLSSYDVGKKSFEGRRYQADIKAARDGMELLVAPLVALNRQLARRKEKQYRPRMVLTLGNHENRITKAVENDAKWDGVISVKDLGYEEYGWEVIPFLEPIIIDGIAYCHYFTTGVMGRPVTSARALVNKKHMSATMGHVQNTELDMSQRRADGTPILGLFAGTYCLHDEAYLGPQGNPTHRQVWMKHEVQDGFYYPMPVSIQYLQKKYG